MKHIIFFLFLLFSIVSNSQNNLYGPPYVRGALNIDVGTINTSSEPINNNSSETKNTLSQDDRIRQSNKQSEDYREENNIIEADKTYLSDVQNTSEENHLTKENYEVFFIVLIVLISLIFYLTLRTKFISKNKISDIVINSTKSDVSKTLSDIEKINKLKNEEIITEEEYEKLKKRILN